MLSIYVTTNLIESVQNIIDSEYRLNELVTVFDAKVQRTETNCLLINEEGIHWPINWVDNIPPYIFPAVELTASNLLATVYFRLGNNEKAWHFLEDISTLVNHFSAFNLLSEGYVMEEEVMQFVQNPNHYNEGNNFPAFHNEAIIRHYGNFATEQSSSDIENLYQKAISIASNAELIVFSTKHYAIFLLDIGKINEAETLLRNAETIAISIDAIHALKSTLADVLLKKLVIPYDDFLIGELKSLTQETLHFERKANNKPAEGFRLFDASHISLIDKSYSEALGYLNKAIDIFETEGYKAFFGEGMRRKGSLLYTWAQDGNPQFFKSALDSYLKALKVYSKEEAPSVFADIHHNLGIIYAEMPTEDKKKGLMAGIALTSFQQALGFYTKENYPYEYAAICTHYGNALCKFPPTINTDNFEKALSYYNDALEIRTKKYPLERAITLLNYIEASWSVKDDHHFNTVRYADMRRKAEEVLMLVQEEAMRVEAENHLANLEKLKTIASV